MQTKEFVLRFYGQTEEGVRACLLEMQAAKSYVPADYVLRPGSVSFNHHTRPSHEVELVASKETCDRMMASATLRAIYQRYAVVGPGKDSAKLVVVKPGMPVWNFKH